ELHVHGTRSQRERVHHVADQLLGLALRGFVHPAGQGVAADDASRQPLDRIAIRDECKLEFPFDDEPIYGNLRTVDVLFDDDPLATRSRKSILESSRKLARIGYLTHPPLTLRIDGFDNGWENAPIIQLYQRAGSSKCDGREPSLG